MIVKKLPKSTVNISLRPKNNVCLFLIIAYNVLIVAYNVLKVVHNVMTVVYNVLMVMYYVLLPLALSRQSLLVLLHVDHE